MENIRDEILKQVENFQEQQQKKYHTYQCRYCARKFLTEYQRFNHEVVRHNADLTEGEQQQTNQTEEKLTG
jgi:5-methylcytosine-specific restriction endonuclease McrA